MDGMNAGFAGAKTGPSHGTMSLCGALVTPVSIEAFRFIGLLAPLGWRHINSVLAIGCEYSVTNSSGVNLDNEVARRVRNKEVPNPIE